VSLRLSSALACAPLLACAAGLAVAAAGCAALLDLPAPELLDDGGEVTFEGGPIDTGTIDVPVGQDAGHMDSTFDVAPEADATMEAQPQDVASEPPPDVAPDTGPVNGGGIPCGLSGQTCDAFLSCCESVDDAGFPVFACVPSEQRCSGYFVACASDNDCPSGGPEGGPNNQICCHYASYIHCETPTMSGTCPGGAGVVQVCDPNNPGECLSGQTCTLHLRNQNLASPYIGCQ
jgi:hypothetical protein